MLTAIWQAKVINETLGGPFVAPWDVSELPDEWIEAITGMRRVPELRAAKQRVEEWKEKWRERVNRRQ